MIPVDVEKSFTDFIRTFGGEVIEDKYGTSLDFSNADFLFRDQNVIGELKRLVDDKNKDENIQSKIQAKFDLWMEEGTIGPIYGRNIINSKTLPERCQRELIDLYKPALQKRILKANKQIRETADFFGMPDAKGIVFIANDGNYALEADAAIYLISRILGQDCSSIHSFVYFTVNMPASGPMTDKAILVWVHANRRKILEPVDSDFVMNIFRSWRSFLEVLRGEHIEEITINDPVLDQIKHDRQA